jgi:hypothetical protein
VNGGDAFEARVERSAGVRCGRQPLDPCEELLGAVDERIVAELARRVEIWTSATRRGAGANTPSSDRLTDETIRELLSVVDTLTRRECARRSHGETVTLDTGQAARTGSTSGWGCQGGRSAEDAGQSFELPDDGHAVGANFDFDDVSDVVAVAQFDDRHGSSHLRLDLGVAE